MTCGDFIELLSAWERYTERQNSYLNLKKAQKHRLDAEKLDPFRTPSHTQSSLKISDFSMSASPFNEKPMSICQST